MHGIATLSYTNCQSATKLILGQNVAGYRLITGTVADLQHGNKHGHHLPGGIVLALPFNRYFSC